MMEHLICMTQRPNSHSDFAMYIKAHNDMVKQIERLNYQYQDGIIAIITSQNEKTGKTFTYAKDIGTSVHDCFKSFVNTNARWIINSHAVFRVDLFDKINESKISCVFRAWKPNVKASTKIKLLHKIFVGSCSASTLRKYTKTIGEDIAIIYGWSVNSGRNQK